MMVRDYASLPARTQWVMLQVKNKVIASNALSKSYTEAIMRIPQIIT